MMMSVACLAECACPLEPCMHATGCVVLGEFCCLHHATHIRRLQVLGLHSLLDAGSEVSAGWALASQVLQCTVRPTQRLFQAVPGIAVGACDPPLRSLDKML